MQDGPTDFQAALILTFVTCAYFYAGAGWNQNAQFDLTRAIVWGHTVAIDRIIANTGDISRHSGHVYANKAPASRSSAQSRMRCSMPSSAVGSIRPTR